MGFLPVIYAGAFFLAAVTVSLICTQLPAKLKIDALAVFIAVLGFGACSYIGVIAAILALGISPLKSLAEYKFTWAAAYVVTGLIGAWVCLKALRLAKQGLK